MVFHMKMENILHHGNKLMTTVIGNGIKLITLFPRPTRRGCDDNWGLGRIHDSVAALVI